MDMFTPATTDNNESPDTGHEEFEAAAEHESEQYEQEEQEQEYEQKEELTEEEQTDPEEGHSERLLAGKFKSADDLEKAYQELQRAFTQQRMQQKAAPQPQQQQPIQQEQDGIDFADPASIIDAINRDPKGTIERIAQQAFQQARSVETQQEQANRAIQEVAQTYSEQLQDEGGQEAYFAKVREISLELGINVKNPSPRILKMAAEELFGKPKGPSTAQLYQQAKTAAREQVAQSRQQKVGLSAPKGAKVQETPKTEADLIRESIVAASRRGGMFG